MSERQATVDVAELPSSAFGNQGLVWWGTVGFMVIEGSMFVIGLVVYFYLRIQVRDWPPSLPNPDLGYGTANLALVLVSLVPAYLAKIAAEKYDLRRLRLWLTTLVVF